ncbi:MAG: ParB/RepB/Spo0J family partition protein [Flexistipes sinusarabici]|uniref:ParB/RepB/Spo0J family partition protein n=1 Tax=Flexistipes sinusarabici TaxID=2352 RepID=A0A5D0MZF4_FLESI|nr:ParB/RepB/Spo0J family partition protein [Flexistipes sinusarabici]TYB37315.1 MAG: ParB/RepB/Spo0J family partition protein [Flexistipes sinusarabici]
MKNKSPLGRGLESLIPKNEAESKNVAELDISDIQPNPEQPRKSFDRESLQELVESIKSKGVIQPLIVGKFEDKFILIAGERRWRAAGLAGLKKVPVVVRDIKDEQEKLELAIIENIQRENLNPPELATAYKNLMEKYGYSQEQVAVVVGKSRSAVANSLRLLSLPPEILKSLEKGSISEGHARALLGLNDKETILEVFRKILQKKLTVRQTEDLIKKLNKGSNIQPEKEDKSVFIKDIEEELENYFHTKVEVKHKKNGGTIEIKYSTQDELNRIINELRGEK